MTSNKNHLNEEKLNSTLLYKGKSFSFYTDEVRLPDGRKAKRDYVRYPEAAVILPLTEENDIIMIEQFRYPIGKALLELPAGKIDDPDEPKEKAAYRELLEETGYSANKMSFLTSYYPAVGYCTELIHAFYAKGLVLNQQSLDEDEFIDIRIVSFKDAIDMIKSGKIADAKTILTILFYNQIIQ